MKKQFNPSFDTNLTHADVLILFKKSSGHTRFIRKKFKKTLLMFGTSKKLENSLYQCISALSLLNSFALLRLSRLRLEIYKIDKSLINLVAINKKSGN